MREVPELSQSRWDQPPEVESGVKGPSQPSLNPFILQVGELRPRGGFEYVLCARCFKAITPSSLLCLVGMHEEARAQQG